MFCHVLGAGGEMWKKASKCRDSLRIERIVLGPSQIFQGVTLLNIEECSRGKASDATSFLIIYETFTWI